MTVKLDVAVEVGDCMDKVKNLFTDLKNKYGAINLTINLHEGITRVHFLNVQDLFDVADGRNIIEKECQIHKEALFIVGDIEFFTLLNSDYKKRELEELINV